MFMSIIWVYFASKKAQDRRFSLFSLIARITNLWTLLIKTAALLPVSQVFVVAVACRNNDIFHKNVQCYSKNMHFFNLALGVTGGAGLILYSLLAQLLFIDLNPSSNVVFAAPRSYLEVFKLFLKLATPLYFVLDSEVSKHILLVDHLLTSSAS